VYSITSAITRREGKKKAKRVTSKHLTFTGGTKRFDYAYNNVSDITAVQRDSSLGDGYTYDLTQEILGYAQNGIVNLGAGTVTNPATNTTLTFDGCGNRTSMNGGGTYVANNLNQYTTFNGAAVTSDATGNLQTWTGWTYTYDAQNRLTNATNGSATAAFYYDAKNRQIARSIAGVVTFSVWDDWELVEEYTTGNVVTAKYLQGAHGPVKSLIDNIYFYQDSLGSTSHIASSSGALLEYYKYDLYGKPTYWNASGNQIWASAVKDLFSGERWIPEISMYDLRNRFYSPDLGRFLQPDPIGFKGDASNLYRYCGNDWANRTDPMGLNTIDGGETRVDSPSGLADGYGETTIDHQIASDFSKRNDGVHITVRDFTLIPKSKVSTRWWRGQADKSPTFRRLDENIERTSKHEKGHRDHAATFEEKNHDRMVKELNAINKDKAYENKQSAEKALDTQFKELLKREFINRDYHHQPPWWKDWRPQRWETPSDARKQEPIKEDPKQDNHSLSAPTDKFKEGQ